MASVMAITTMATLFNKPVGAISNETRPTLVGREIRMGDDGDRIKMTGVNVWGIETITLDGFGDSQYADRVTIINTIKSWGANHIRFRLQASDYNAETFMTKAEYLNRIVEWRNLAAAAGLYFMPTWWDAHDGPYSNANWATQYNQAFPMMADVVAALGNDPLVLYEPFNEPMGSINDVQWLAAMRDTVRYFREDLNYTGILLIDPRVWSHCYDSAAFTNIENYDASLEGMNGRHQIVFTKHDYAREFDDPESGFDPQEWAENSGGCGIWDFTQHAVWESEFGNYSIDPTSVHPEWSEEAVEWMGEKVIDGTLVGATPFLFGPWLDENGMTEDDNTTPTLWGEQVRDGMFGQNYGLNGIGTLGNIVFFDANGDGIYNPVNGDTGLENVTVSIYPNATAQCSTPTGLTPIATTTTNSSGRYQFTLLPTDDENATNGPGANYTVVVTDTNNVLGEYIHTTGTPNTNNNSQSQPAFCAELTNLASDIQYADFGYTTQDEPAPPNPPTPSPTNPTDSEDSNTEGSLADTGDAIATMPFIALGLIVLGVGTVITVRYYAQNK